MRNVRSSLIVTALMGAAAAAGANAQVIEAGPRAWPRRQFTAADPLMTYGRTKRSGSTTAQVKRAAVKARNRARNKAAHRG